jgi:hypothetical protein
MEHINMKECLNCGYERQPKDEGIVPATECPRCGILYSKIKDGDAGLKDASGQKHNEGKEFQKDNGIQEIKNESMTEEIKRFHISKVLFISPAIAALLLTFLTVIQIVDCLLRIGTDRPFLFPFLVLLILILISSWLWLRFLRLPYKITVSHGQLIFRSPIRTVKMNVGDLISVYISKSRYTLFKSRRQSIRSISNIRERDELINIIKSANPTIEIKQSKRFKIGCGIAILIFILFTIILAINISSKNKSIESSFNPVIGALERYKSANSAYPDKLEALTPIYLDVLPMAEYYHVNSGKYIKLEALTPTYLDALPMAGYYHVDSGEYKLGGYVFLFSKHMYSSSTKQWTNED